MEAPLTHCPEELILLKLLEDAQLLLAAALNSLGGKSSADIGAKYLVEAAKGINRVAGGYLVLRQKFHVHASKLVIRSAIELLIYGTAATKSKEFHFRKAYSEWKEDQKLFAKNVSLKAEGEIALSQLEKRFASDLPEFPVQRKKLQIKDAAAMAGMDQLYETHFAIYCQYTHGSLRALTGDLDAETDVHDTIIVCWCVLMILDLLKAKTPAYIPDMATLHKRLLDASGTNLA